MAETKRTASKQIFTALIATIPTLTYGIQIGWLSPMASVLKSASSSITNVHITWMAAAVPLAGICGIPLFSYCSDRFGRKICIIAVSLLSSISWILTLCLITPAVLIISRGIAGIAAAGCFVVIPVYIKEISEDSRRGSLASLTMTMSKAGVIFVYAVGMSCSYTVSQSVFLTISLAHALFFCWMPESPNYLLKIGDKEKAAKTLSWLRDAPRSSYIVTEEIERLCGELKRHRDVPQLTFNTLVRDKATFGALRLTLTLMAMQTLSGCFALLNYASDVFRRGGTGWSPNALALAVAALQLGGAFFTTLSIERCGRKIPLFWSSLLISICMATLATCFLLKTTYDWLLLLSICVCLLAYGVGLAPIPIVMMAEVFPYELRARMAGISMAFSFFCSSMTVLFYSPIAEAFGLHVVFYTFSAITLLGALYSVFYVPETKGKSLAEIQAYWKTPEPVFV